MGCVVDIVLAAEYLLDNLTIIVAFGVE